MDANLDYASIPVLMRAGHLERFALDSLYHKLEYCRRHANDIRLVFLCVMEVTENSFGCQEDLYPSAPSNFSVSQACEKIRQQPQFVVGMADGNVGLAGTCLLTSCDTMLATDRSAFVFVEAHGLDSMHSVPISVLHNVSADVMRRLLDTRGAVNVEIAKSLGLITRIISPAEFWVEQLRLRQDSGYHSTSQLKQIREKRYQVSCRRHVDVEQQLGPRREAGKASPLVPDCVDTLWWPPVRAASSDDPVQPRITSDLRSALLPPNLGDPVSFTESSPMGGSKKGTLLGFKDFAHHNLWVPETISFESEDAVNDLEQQRGKSANHRFSEITQDAIAGMSSAAKEADPLFNFTHHNGPITSLMLCNIPCRVTQDELSEMIDSLGFKDAYDFLYLPVSNRGRRMTKSASNLGYGFINFIDPCYIEAFGKAFAEYKFENTSSHKSLNVKTAHIQGLAANVSYFSQSSSSKTPKIQL